MDLILYFFSQNEWMPINKSKYVFAQLNAFLGWNHFNYLVRKYSGQIREALHMLEATPYTDV